MTEKQINPQVENLKQKIINTISLWHPFFYAQSVDLQGRF